jgi:hypothetical protein
MKRLAALCLAGVLTTTACSDDGVQGQADSPRTVQGDGGSADGIICGEAEFDIARTVPDMLIVLDRSNSMGSGASPLWDTTRNALYSITASMDSQVWFGLFVYPGPLCTGANDLARDCSAPTDPTVPLGPGKSGAIKTALTPMKVCGGTPIAATLMAAGQYLQTKVPASNHARYILLATDGGPDCNHSLDLSTCTCTPGGSCVVPENCLDDARTNKVLGELCAAGIKTYVVGLGSVQLEAAVLQAMAQHGCTGKPYTPADPAAITKTFGEIAAGVATCSFEMDCSKIPDPGLVNFYFDGKLVPRINSHSGGWDWVVPCKGNNIGKVEFFGFDCEAIKANQVKKVSATFGCATNVKIE